MHMQVGSLDLNILLAMVRRRLWLSIGVGSCLCVIVASLAFFLPQVYRTSAVLLVEGRELPSDFVRSSGSVPVETRLSTISQEVLSNARLEKLIHDFALGAGRLTKPMDALVDSVRKAILVDVTESGRDGAIAFSVSFSGTDPQKVTDVTNALASFYVERNASLREQQTSGVATVLQTEIEQMKKKLEEHERRLQQYRERYMGELPEQLDANTKALDRLQDRIQVLDDEIGQRRVRRGMLASQTLKSEATPNSSNSAIDALTSQVLNLRHQLAELQTRYSDKYPDVEQTKRELESLEERLRLRTRRANDETGDRRRLLSSHPGNNLQTYEFDAEIRRLESERKRLQQQMSVHQQRIDNTPKRDVELQSLTRDYAALREKYTSLIGRQEEAKLTSGQKGEQFRVLDPATYPTYPIGPQRLRLFLASLVLGLGAAIGSAVVWEKFVDTSFHRADELEAAMKLPVVVTIPKIAAQNGGMARMRGEVMFVASLVLALCVVVGAVRLFAQNNTQLAMKFSGRPSSASK
jgi:polysaccharide chain length determinant protein (PEP-CTERM system associated)